MKWHAGSVADTAEAPPMPDRIAAMQRTGKECQKGTSLLEGCSLLKAISEHWNQKSWSYFLGAFRSVCQRVHSDERCCSASPVVTAVKSREPNERRSSDFAGPRRATVQWSRWLHMRCAPGRTSPVAFSRYIGGNGNKPQTAASTNIIISDPLGGSDVRRRSWPRATTKLPHRYFDAGRNERSTLGAAPQSRLTLVFREFLASHSLANRP